MNKEEIEDKIEYSKKYLENRYNHTGDYDLKYSLKTIIDLQQENKQLQQRIYKAIEYIAVELLTYDNESDECVIGKRLCEILKGDY